MLIKIYILIVALLLFSLIVPYFIALRRKNSRPQKIQINIPLKARLSNLQRHILFKRFIITEGRFYSRIQRFINQYTVFGINTSQIQVLSLLSVYSLFAFQYLVWLNNAFNTLIFSKNIQIIAESIGNPAMATVTSPHILRMGIISLIGYFIPYGAILIIHRVLKNKTESESILLQSYAIMLLKTNKGVKYILEILYHRANMFKEPLRVCLENYSTDAGLALQELVASSGNERFRTTISALEKSLFYDREMAVTYLSNIKKLQNNLQRIKIQKKDKDKQLMGAILLVVPLACFAAVAGYPWMILLLQVLTGLSF